MDYTAIMLLALAETLLGCLMLWRRSRSVARR